MAASVIQSDDEQNVSQLRRKEASVDLCKQAGIQSFAGFVGDLIEQITEQQAACGEGERCRHREHGFFAGL